MLLAVALAAIFAAGAFGQVTTSTVAYDDSMSRSRALSFKVNEPAANVDGSSHGALEKSITYALESELISNGFLPVIAGKSADLLVSFYLEVKDTAGPAGEGLRDEEGALIVEFHDARTNRRIWRGVAASVTGLKPVDPYRWEERITEAARMLVRRFNEEKGPGGLDGGN
jgi:hypothetical protein